MSITSAEVMCCSPAERLHGRQFECNEDFSPTTGGCVPVASCGTTTITHLGAASDKGLSPNATADRLSPTPTIFRFSCFPRCFGKRFLQLLGDLHVFNTYISVHF